MRIIAHLDLDAFFATCEELEQPELREVPLVVGGDPRSRGVVATANYVARRFGIHSAMSCAEAARRCPQAVFLRPRPGLYRTYSDAAWTAIEEVVPRVERLGLDEGYLELSELCETFTGARDIASAVQTSVRAATSLTCSLGVSTSKVVSKIASDVRKPGGVTVVAPGREAEFLAPLVVRTLPGVGPRAEERLHAAGVRTIGELAALDSTRLRAVLPGAYGALLGDRARGVDDRDVEEPSDRVSISVEVTFARDIVERATLHDELGRLAGELTTRMRREGVAGRTLTAKLRYADFSIRSRSTTLPAAVDDEARIAELARTLLERGLADRPGALRLVGIGVSGLTTHRQLVLDTG